jgi:hypothetical protein
MLLKYGKISRPREGPVAIIPVLVHSVYERRPATSSPKQHVSFPVATSIRQVPQIKIKIAVLYSVFPYLISQLLTVLCDQSHTKRLIKFIYKA